MRIGLPSPTSTNVRRLTLANLAANIGLVLTGGLVAIAVIVMAVATPETTGREVG